MKDERNFFSTIVKNMSNDARDYGTGAEVQLRFRDTGETALVYLKELGLLVQVSYDYVDENHIHLVASDGYSEEYALQAFENRSGIRNRVVIDEENPKVGDYRLGRILVGILAKKR